MFCPPSRGLGLPCGRPGSAQVTNNILSKIFPENSETLWLTALQVLDGVGGSSCFSFGSNMEMLSAAPTDRENEDKIRSGVEQDKQG